ncbi:SdpI family protein [Paenibacillus faecalis]|uniref:SdpI family protein n=1 Tax=Paenibacillus faecalis TaxID=2079532 RepID=UPI000D102C69|nr:SdpI family protein [Paenibacillus faecalis]
MLLNLSLGAILFISGAVLFLFPPKKINAFYGYRTYSSMKNEWTWKTANRYGSQLMMIFGSILLFIAATTGHFATTAVSTIISFLLINILIEKKLKKM